MQIPEFISKALSETMNQKIAEYIADGLSINEIQNSLDKEVESEIDQLIETTSSSYVENFKNVMYPNILQERNTAKAFIANNIDSVWQEGFVASESMYLIVLEMASQFNAIFRELSPNETRGKEFRYYVLKELHGRACQQYLEILELLKGGFADGAYARWRSLYEICVIADFIQMNDDKVAKRYFEESFDDKGKNEWAKSAPCFSTYKHVTLADIKKQCEFYGELWKDQYRLANKVVHASPEETFNRLGVSPDTRKRIIPVGRTNYGLASPAINSAISLCHITTFFFRLVTRGDTVVYIRALTKWVDYIQKVYLEIEKSCFSTNSSDDTP